MKNVRRFRRLEHIELQFGGLAHHAGIPDGVEHHVDMDIAYSRNELDTPFDIPRNDWTHAAPRGGQRHGDKDIRLAWDGIIDLDVVDEPELDNIHGNFRVVAFFQRVPNLRVKTQRLGLPLSGFLRFRVWLSLLFVAHKSPLSLRR